MCQKCKENVDARAPLRPQEVADLRRLRGKAMQSLAANWCRKGWSKARQGSPSNTRIRTCEIAPYARNVS